MVEASNTSGLPALVDYIAFAQDRELMQLIGNGKNQSLNGNFRHFVHYVGSLNICASIFLIRITNHIELSK